MSIIEIFLGGALVLLLMALFVLFFSTLGDRPHKLTINQGLPLDSEEFLITLARTVHASLEYGGTITPLQNGKGFLPELLTCLEGAKRTINFTVYIWEEGEMLDSVFEVLASKARSGVEVRVLVDSFGNKAPRDRFLKLARTGVKVKRFRSLKFGTLSRIHRRTHRRAIIIDGEVGFTGGMAISDKWLGDAEKLGHWRDTMFKLTGPMARSLQSAFADLWAGSRGEVLVGTKFYPDIFSNETEISNIPYIHLVSSPSDDTQPIPIFLWLSFSAAQKSIHITTPYFIPDSHMVRALIKQARKGLDVKLLVPNHLTDAQPVRFASHYYYDKLLRAGIRIFEYQPTFIHTKTIVIDGVWSIVGSANLNSRSSNLDEENIFGIMEKGLATQLEVAFTKDAGNSEEVHRTLWGKRGWYRKIREKFWWMFIKQF